MLFPFKKINLFLFLCLVYQSKDLKHELLIWSYNTYILYKNLIINILKHQVKDIMKFTKNLNSLSENEFISIFGSVFEKSEWIASDTFKKKPFKNSKDLMDKMINTYSNTSNEKILKIFNLHPKLAIEKKLTNFSSKEQSDAKLNTCTKDELIEFEKLNFDYEKKFNFPFIIAVKGKNKEDILNNFRERINNDYQKEFTEAKTQVKKIALFRLNEILEN